MVVLLKFLVCYVVNGLVSLVCDDEHNIVLYVV